MRENRQYICLDCMSFWFVDELCYRSYDTEEDNLKIPICPNCRGNVNYVGERKDRKSKHLFGERIANLEYMSKETDAITV